MLASPPREQPWLRGVRGISLSFSSLLVILWQWNHGAACFPTLNFLCFSNLCHWWIRSGKSPLQMSLWGLTRRWLGMWIHLSTGTTAPLLQPAVSAEFLLTVTDINWCLSCTKATRKSFGFLGQTFCPVRDALLCTLLEDQVKSDTWNLPSVHQTCKICSGVIFSLNIPYWVYFHWKDSNLNFQWPFPFPFCLNKNKYNFYLNCITPQCARFFSLGSLWLSCHGYCWHFHLDTVLWVLCPLHRLSGEPFVTCGLKHSSRHIHSTNH